jgi:hypothetical protein
VTTAKRIPITRNNEKVDILFFFFFTCIQEEARESMDVEKNIAIPIKK